MPEHKMVIPQYGAGRQRKGFNAELAEVLGGLEAFAHGITDALGTSDDIDQRLEALRHSRAMAQLRYEKRVRARQERERL